MKDIVLYCKSYHRDFLRLRRLVESIQHFNQDKIDFYISTPESEKDLLDKVLLGAGDYLWVSDESIVLSNPKADLEKYNVMPGRLSQQIVKAEFWRLNFCQNYVCLDSDSIFIKDFEKKDFIDREGTPYTVLHQNKDLFQLAVNRGYIKFPNELKAEAIRVQNLFERIGPQFYCAPSPFIWSAKVWESLDQKLLIPAGINIWSFIREDLPESLIYGESLLRFKAIPLHAIEPIFRVYHFNWQYFLMLRLGENKQKLASNYLGVLYQSSWESDLNFGTNSKNWFSRQLRKFKHFLRYLQSFV